jgi:hypothetical protein
MGSPAADRGACRAAFVSDPTSLEGRCSNQTLGRQRSLVLWFGSLVLWFSPLVP